jgi:hypothetical protein
MTQDDLEALWRMAPPPGTPPWPEAEHIEIEEDDDGLTVTFKSNDVPNWVFTLTWSLVATWFAAVGLGIVALLVKLVSWLSL